jgi:hypothetical protein
MRVWLATLLLLFSWYGWFDCSLKPRFGTTFLFALACFITFTNIAFMVFSVIAQAVVSVLTVTTGLALDVTFLASGLAFAFDVAFIAARLSAGLFTNLTVTVLRAVGRRVPGFVADSAGLIQERWADNFTIGSWLVLDEVAGVFFFGFSGITTHLAERGGGGGAGGGGGLIVSSGRHFDWLILIETVVRVV